jgi:hypothetical protein
MKLDRPTLALVAVSLASTAWLAVSFTFWTATTGWAFPLFLAVLFVLIYLPGRLTLRVLQLAPSPLEGIGLSLALGLPVVTVAYWACAYGGRPRLVWSLPVAAVLVTLCPRFRFRRCGWRPRYAHAALVLVAVLVLVPCVSSPLYFQNLIRADGTRTAYLLADVVAHVSIASELTHAVPPQNPFLPDRPLVYHYGIHLLAAAFAAFGLSVPDLMARFLPVLFLGFTVLGSFALARRWLGSEGWAVLAALLVISGEDFSFLGGPHAGLSQTWASYFFEMPTVISLYLMNPMLPALGVLMVVLLCLERFLATEERSWLVAVLFLAPVLAVYKVFAAAHLLLGLGATAVVYAILYRRWAAMVATAAIGCVVVPPVLAMSAGYHGLDLALHPWPYVTDAIVRLGLRWTWVGQQALAFQRGEYRLLPILGFFGIALPGYLVLALGARSLGIAVWFRGLRPARGEAFRFLMAAFVLTGIVLAMIVSATAAGYPRRAFGNNACWFFVQSKYLMWLFALEPLRHLRRGAAILAAGLLLALSLPSAVHFHVLQAQQRPSPLEPQLAEAVDFLNREVRPGETCLAREGAAQVILVWTKCHALALGIFPSSYLSPAALEVVTQAREEFWRRWREEPNRLPDETLATWRVDYVVTELSSDGKPAVTPAGANVTLEPRFSNAEYAIYRVRRPQ